MNKTPVGCILPWETNTWNCYFCDSIPNVHLSVTHNGIEWRYYCSLFNNSPERRVLIDKNTSAEIVLLFIERSIFDEVSARISLMIEDLANLNKLRRILKNG